MRTVMPQRFGGSEARTPPSLRIAPPPLVMAAVTSLMPRTMTCSLTEPGSCRRVCNGVRSTPLNSVSSNSWPVPGDVAVARRTSPRTPVSVRMNGSTAKRVGGVTSKPSAVR